MESLRGMRCHRRAPGRSYFPHQAVVHLHFFPYAGLTYYCIYGISILDEHEALHPYDAKEPV